ncbi:MAG TPA: hypothetical protein VLB90_10865 [Pseudomonadales bacterium]|nr:hypothetical protein [Pseudomonadales bacterium]
MMPINRTLSAAALLASGLLASSSLFAAPPGARTLDQMVNLVVDKNSSLCPIYGYAVNQQINADGSLSPFSIPDGYSLVITGLNWYQYVIGSGESARYEGRLSIQGTEAATIFSDFRFDSGNYNQGGSVTGISDVVVQPGVALCYGAPILRPSAYNMYKEANANVHGYLVKNRSKSDAGNDDHGHDGDEHGARGSDVSDTDSERSSSHIRR